MSYSPNFFTNVFLEVLKVFQIPSTCVKNYFSEIQRDISDIKNVAEDSIFSEKDSSNIDDKKKDE